jgi:hypothetical protein
MKKHASQIGGINTVLLSFCSVVCMCVCVCVFLIVHWAEKSLKGTILKDRMVTEDGADK